MHSLSTLHVHIPYKRPVDTMSQIYNKSNQREVSILINLIMGIDYSSHASTPDISM